MNYVFTLYSVFKSVPPKTQNQPDKPVYFTHADIVLSYVIQTMYLLGNLPLRFMSIILWPGMTHFVSTSSQNACCG